jgi:hypothetical protein
VILWRKLGGSYTVTFRPFWPFWFDHFSYLHWHSLTSLIRVQNWQKFLGRNQWLWLWTRSEDAPGDTYPQFWVVPNIFKYLIPLHTILLADSLSVVINKVYIYIYMSYMFVCLPVLHRSSKYYHKHMGFPRDFIAGQSPKMPPGLHHFLLVIRHSGTGPFLYPPEICRGIKTYENPLVI